MLVVVRRDRGATPAESVNSYVVHRGPLRDRGHGERVARRDREVVRAHVRAALVRRRVVEAGRIAERAVAHAEPLGGRVELGREPVEVARRRCPRSRTRRRSPTPSSARPASGRAATRVRPAARSCSLRRRQRGRPSTTWASGSEAFDADERGHDLRGARRMDRLVRCWSPISTQPVAGVDDDVGLRRRGAVAAPPRDRSPPGDADEEWRAPIDGQQRRATAASGRAAAHGRPGVGREQRQRTERAGRRLRGVPRMEAWRRPPHLGPHRRHPGIGDARGRRQGQGAEGRGRERHRLRRRRARLPDARARSSRRPRPRAASPRFHHYSPTPGLPELREAIAHKTKRDSGVDCAAAQVVVTNGGKHAVYNTFQVLCDPGDEVLVARAVLDLVSRSASRSAAGCRSCCRPRRRRAFASRSSSSTPRVTPRTKALLFVSPSNPTGAVYPPDEVEAIGRWALERGIWVVTDEIYEHLTYDGHVVLVDAGARARADEPVRDPQRRREDVRDDRLARRLDDRPARRHRGRDQPAVALDVERVERRAGRRARGGLRRPRRRRRDARRVRAPGQHDVRAARRRSTASACCAPEGAFYCFPSFEGVLGREIAGRTPAERRSSCARCCST